MHVLNFDRITLTVKDDGTDNPVRVYSRVEEMADIEITEFDGEGMISPNLAYILDPLKEENHPHHSFQIRMPYIKGVVHELDFKTLFASLGVTQIRDVFGQLHSIHDVDMILTKSMFKGFGWMKENGISLRTDRIRKKCPLCLVQHPGKNEKSPGRKPKSEDKLLGSRLRLSGACG